MMASEWQFAPLASRHQLPNLFFSLLFTFLFFFLSRIKMEVRLIEHNDDEIYLNKIGEIFSE